MINQRDAEPVGWMALEITPQVTVHDLLELTKKNREGEKSHVNVGMRRLLEIQNSAQKKNHNQVGEKRKQKLSVGRTGRRHVYYTDEVCKSLP